MSRTAFPHGRPVLSWYFCSLCFSRLCCFPARAQVSRLSADSSPSWRLYYCNLQLVHLRRVVAGSPQEDTALACSSPSSHRALCTNTVDWFGFLKNLSQNKFRLERRTNIIRHLQEKLAVSCQR